MASLQLHKLETLIFERLKSLKHDRELKRLGVDISFIPDTPNTMYDRVKNDCTITLAIPSFVTTSDSVSPDMLVTVDVVVSIINISRKQIYQIIDLIINLMLSQRKFILKNPVDETISEYCCDSILYDNIKLTSYRLFPAEGNLWRAELNFTIDRIL